MDITTHRRISARILLAVFLTIQVLAIIHIHEDMGEDVICHDCVAHVHHNGHLSSASFAIDSCLICQFLSLPYTMATALLLIAIFHTETRHYGCFAERLYNTASQFVFLRAPPVIG